MTHTQAESSSVSIPHAFSHNTTLSSSETNDEFVLLSDVPRKSIHSAPKQRSSKTCLLPICTIILSSFILFFISYHSIHILNPHSFFASLFSYYHNTTPRYLAFPMLSVQNDNEYALRWKVYLPPAYSFWSEVHKQQHDKQYYYTSNAAMKSKPPLKLQFFFNGREMKVRNPDRLDQSWYEVRWKNHELHGTFSIRVSLDSWVDYYYWWVFYYNNRIETSRVDRVRWNHEVPPKRTGEGTTAPGEVSPSTTEPSTESLAHDDSSHTSTPSRNTPSSLPPTPQLTQFQNALNSILPSSIMYRRQQITHESLGANSFLTTEDLFQMVWVSDNQMGHSTFRDVIRQIEYRHYDSTDLMVHGGDRIQRGHVNQEWHTHYHDIMQPLFRRRAVPFINIVGNHDLGNSLFKWTTEHKFYQKTFHNGQLQVIVLDSLFDSQNQREWLDRVLAKSKAKFRIVCTHIPPFIEYWDPESWNFPKNEKSWNSIMQSYYAPVFERHGVNLVLSGHQHNYQRGKRSNTHYVVSGGAGGEMDHDQVENYGFYDVTRFDHHYLVLKMQREKDQSDQSQQVRYMLQIEARNRQGNLIDEFSIAES
eukprot:CAMPEP_0117439000 /NCGR_PEP_ID=MMETSP0759-20121206/2344_1 /TAXON_ID=63605 /ORGANISM="Percolomonas cosmopolitus, Strain WS" /LENGTH=588 /DNA_ID=CAMNT_0005230711 /DNA_START=835 /DNA_END=2598 /DNA_ORIENTATION=+